MKKFSFTLGRLLDYKRQLLKNEKNTLSQLRAQLQRVIDEREELKRRLDESNEDFQEKCRNGITTTQIITIKTYHNSLIEQIKQLDKMRGIVEDKIEKQLDVVVEATKEVSSIEKLEEKQLVEYNEAVRKSEELFIEEHVSHTKFTSSGQ